MDWYFITFVLAILAMIMTVIAQMRVKGVYHRYSNTANARGITGAQAARELLDAAGVRDMAIEEIDGVLTDHYDPRAETLRLSKGVYGSTSLSAIGIAAHEAAHAIQHFEGYAPLMARQNFVRFAGIGSRMSMPIVFIGIIIMSLEGMGDFGWTLVNVGLLLFTAVVVLSLITLPVELNASSRAIAMLESGSFLSEQELGPARRVLSAAAWTYIASALTAVITLIRLILIARGGRRN